MNIKMRNTSMCLCFVGLFFFVSGTSIKAPSFDQVHIGNRAEGPSYQTYDVDDGYTPEQVHLSIGESANSMTVMWNTANDTKDSTVVYGQDGKMDKKITGTSTKHTSPGTEKRFQYIHTALLTDLQANFTYEYKVGSDASGYSKVFQFHTWPEGSDWSPSLCVYGDLGVDNGQSVPDITNDVAKGMYDAVLHAGDIAYDLHEDNGRRGDDFFNMIEPIAANVPYMTCPGNHEAHYNFSEYRSRFEMPGDVGKRMYFSFNMGPVHLISANSEVWEASEEPSSEVMKMYDWLEADLKEASSPENRQKRPWIILMAHQPMYCSNIADPCKQHPSEIPIRIGIPHKNLPGIEDLSYKYGVDVFLWAHKHGYERMWPLYNSTMYNGSDSAPYTNPGAPVHIISAAAGQREDNDPYGNYHYYSAFRSLEYGYTRVKVFNSSHLHIQQVSVQKSGDVIDDIWVIKEKHGPYHVE